MCCAVASRMALRACVHVTDRGSAIAPAREGCGEVKRNLVLRLGESPTRRASVTQVSLGGTRRKTRLGGR